MTDDKAIEAARKAVLLEMISEVDETMYACGLMSDKMVDKITRVAIVAYQTELARLFWRPLPENMREQSND